MVPFLGQGLPGSSAPWQCREIECREIEKMQVDLEKDLVLTAVPVLPATWR
ncbi:hypothetical protein ASZ90_016840 [hydrocarbon metagenome]|uniref:Uncharacterized protein n=1 Tax=hydrocarbon metagenome TaxID=938273 RepID=A0A0W8EB77_9ZZZZ